MAALFEAANSDYLELASGLPTISFPFSVCFKNLPVSLAAGDGGVVWAFANSSNNTSFITINTSSAPKYSSRRTADGISFDDATFSGVPEILTITGAANNGQGLIRITTSGAHGFSVADQVLITGVGGTTEANGHNWTIIPITSTTFDIVGSTFANAYTAGGTVVRWASVVVVYTAIDAGTLYWNTVAGASLDNTSIALPSASLRIRMGQDAPLAGGAFLDGYLAESGIVAGAMTVAQIADYHFGRRLSDIISSANLLRYASFESSTTPEVGTNWTTNSGVTIVTSVHPHKQDHDPVIHSAVSRTHVKDSEKSAFRALFLDDFATPKKIMVFGDSTSAENGAGTLHMHRRRLDWHEVRGNTPATQLVASGQTTSPAGPGAVQHFIAHQDIHLSSVGSPPYTLADLPPGFAIDDNLVRKYRNDADGSGNGGVHHVLNHNQENEAINDSGLGADGGEPSFLATNMHRPGSYMNLAGGNTLQLEVLALTSPGSADEILVDRLELTDIQPINKLATPITSFSTTGANLDAAVGTVVASNFNFGNSGTTTADAWHTARYTGDDATAYAWFLGSRWKTEDPRGIIHDTFARSGYKASDVMVNHPNCWSKLVQIGYDGAILRFGHNEGNLTVTLAITAVNQGAKTFTVAGDQSRYFVPGRTFPVAGSTGNDGTYTIVSAVYGAATVITVSEAIPDSTADGNIAAPNGVHPAIQEHILRTMIIHIRDMMGDSALPILIEVVPHEDFQTGIGSYQYAMQYYASVALRIAQTVSMVAMINEMRILEDDEGWDQANAGSFTVDGTHYSNFGSFAVADAAVFAWADALGFAFGGWQSDVSEIRRRRRFRLDATQMV